MNKRIKILQVFTTLNRGGAETNFMNYLQHMDLDRFEVEVLVHRVAEGAYEATLKQMGIVIHRLPAIHPFNYWAYQRQAKALLSNGQFDIIHSHMSELSVWLLKIAKELNIPTRIVHAHSSWSSYDLKAPIRWYWKHRLHHYSSHLFSCSKIAADWLFGANSNYFLMRNAINLEVFNLNQNESLNKRKALAGLNTINICHVGSFSKVKNHRFIINVFKQFLASNSNAHLYLIGSGPLEKQVVEWVNINELQSKVHLMGSVSNVQDYLQAMDVMLFPSLFEGLPVSLIEAQAMGLPIVASNSISREVAVIPDLLQFVDLKAPLSEWVNAIEKALTIPRMDRGQAIYAAQYDIDTNAKALEAFYIKAASN